MKRHALSLVVIRWALTVLALPMALLTITVICTPQAEAETRVGIASVPNQQQPNAPGEVARERLARTGWWLPDAASNITVKVVDGANIRLASDIVVIEFDAPRTSIEPMIRQGQGSPFLRAGDDLRSNHREMLSKVDLPRVFQFAQATSQTWPPSICVLILPPGDNPRVIVLCYNSTG